MSAKSLKRVLIVDNDAAVRNSLTRLLRRAGYDVSTATRANGPLKRLRSGEAFDCIVMELLLADMPGRELIETLSNEMLFSLDKLIVLTRLHNVDNATAYLQYGCAAYLGKPYENVHVLNQVARICKGKRNDKLDAFM